MLRKSLDASWRGFLGAVAAVAVLGGLYGVADSKTDDAPRGEATFWNTLRVEGGEVEGYDSLEKMAEAADLVVVGKFSGFGLARQVKVDDSVVTFAEADVAIQSVLRGTLEERDLAVEFLLPVPGGQAPLVLAAQAASLPSEPVVLFLRYMGADSGRYRLVNFDGLWTERQGAIAAPLSGNASTLASRLANLQDLVDLVER